MKPEQTENKKESFLKHSLKKAFGGGIAGSAAMIIQVTSLIWLRTIMNYEYRYGTSTREAARILYQQGGIRRFYKGYIPALAIGPLSRFGDTASNAFVLEYLKNTKLNTGIITMAGSLSAALFRILLMPIDALKTTLQVEGAHGLKILGNKIKVGGLGVIFHGTGASFSATFVGHYPWFLTNNLLKKWIPDYKEFHKKVLKNAGIGFICAVISDSLSNSLRVIKTTKQTYHEPVSYLNVVKHVVDADGYKGLFGRGLKTRIITNGLQGLMFNVFWNIFQDYYFAGEINYKKL